MLKESQIQNRWMIRHDLDEVLSIEEKSFLDAWDENAFANILRERNAIGMTAEIDTCEEGIVGGYVIYQLAKSSLVIKKLAVHSGYRHQGIGRAMILKLQSKLSHQRRCKIDIVVRESNLDALNFFKRFGFKARCLLRNEFRHEDGILMRYRRKPIDEELFHLRPENRIREYFQG